MYWSDFDRTLSVLDQVRRRMDQAFQEADSGHVLGRTAAWPRAALYDAGEEFVLTAEVPGLDKDAIQLAIHQDVLTLEGERKHDAPEGYRAHRRERQRLRFARSFALPTAVDPDKAVADLANGILTVRIAKTPESQPRKITVKG